MEGWEAGEVGSYLTVSRNSGNVAVNILLGGPHSLGGTDDCIHGNKTHDGIYGEKKKQTLNYLCTTGQRGGRRDEMNGEGRMQAYIPLHVRWIDSQWKFTV